MKRNLVKFLFSLFCVVLFVLPALAGDVNLSVAASLKDVMGELTKNYAAGNPSAKFVTNFGGSGALAKQIASGAPADIFFSASTEWADFLKEKKLAEENNISTLAYNVLVFVGKPDLKVKDIKQVTSLDKIAIGSPKSVPCGDYAMQAFRKSGIDKQLEGKLVMAKDVRECLLYAERGEVSGSFVYRTDVDPSVKNVKILFEVPQDLYARVTYPMALTVSGEKNADAAGFFKFLQTDKAKNILAKYGFIIK